MVLTLSVGAARGGASSCAAASAAAAASLPLVTFCSQQAVNLPRSLLLEFLLTPRPELGRLAGDGEVGDHLDAGAGAGLGHRGGDVGARGAVAALVLALGVDHHP